VQDVISEHFRSKNQYFDFSVPRVKSEHHSEQVKEDTNSYYKPKKTITRDRIVRLIGVVVLASWFVNYISGNIDKNNSMDATFAICSSAESINADILWSKFYNYENPYKAAIYIKYFSKNIDTIDDISTIEAELLKIKDGDYLGIRSYAQELINAIEQNDISIVRAMNRLKAECGARESFWSD
jgi:hypothetical protein